MVTDEMRKSMQTYQDVWKNHIQPEKLFAYRKMIDDGKIMIHKVTFYKRTGITIVEYSSEAPHKQILEEMGQLVREMM